MVHGWTAAQTERYALIHHHFVYEYIYRPESVMPMSLKISFPRPAVFSRNLHVLLLLLSCFVPFLCSERTQLYHNSCVLCCCIFIDRHDYSFSMNSCQNDKSGPQFANAPAKPPAKRPYEPLNTLNTRKHKRNRQTLFVFFVYFVVL